MLQVECLSLSVVAVITCIHAQVVQTGGNMLAFCVKQTCKLVPLCKQKVLITVKAPAAVSFSGRLCKRAVVRFGTVSFMLLV